jgi:hypothetical protein
MDDQGVDHVVAQPVAQPALWLSLGAILYMIRLAPGAKIVNASAEVLDLQLVRLRGRSPHRRGAAGTEL